MGKKYAIYVIHDGEQIGPFTKKELREAVHSKSLLPSDAAWCEDFQDWQTIESVLPEIKEQEARRLELARRYPATEKQLALIEDLNIWSPCILSSMDASRLIEEAFEKRKLATEPQKRRLRFYNIPLTGGLTKLEATKIIDAYIQEHPESEEKYQEWKIETAGEIIPPMPRDEISLIRAEVPLDIKKKSNWRYSIFITLIMAVIFVFLFFATSAFSQTPLPSPTPTLEERKAAMMEKFRAQQAEIRQAKIEADAKAKAEKQKEDELEALVKGIQIVGYVRFYRISGEENRGYVGEYVYRHCPLSKREVIVIGKLPKWVLTGNDYQLAFYLTGEIRDDGGDRTEIVRLDPFDAMAHLEPQRKESILTGLNSKESNSLLKDSSR